MVNEGLNFILFTHEWEDASLDMLSLLVLCEFLK